MMMNSQLDLLPKSFDEKERPRTAAAGPRSV